LRRNGLVGLAVIALGEPRDQEGVVVLEAGWFEIGEKRLVHHDRLHKRDVVEVALGAHRFGRLPELVAERPRECLVGAVTRVERDRQDVGRAVAQRLGGLARPAAAHVAHHRAAGRLAERARHVVARHARGRGDLAERDVVGEMTFDVPERLSDRVHCRLSYGAGALSADPLART
jgi:hypothetical protein